jgi:hypothetical protein
VKANQHEFCAADWAGIVDPVRLQARRAKARAAARQRAVQRLMEAFPAEWEAFKAEEFAAMELEFQRQLDAAMDRVIRERLGGVA